jgi:hypothetical protein
MVIFDPATAVVCRTVADTRRHRRLQVHAAFVSSFVFVHLPYHPVVVKQCKKRESVGLHD